MITETIRLLISAVTGEIIQSGSLPDSRRDAFDQNRTNTSENVASHARFINAQCLLHNKCSIFADCNPPNCGQQHFDNISFPVTTTIARLRRSPQGHQLSILAGRHSLANNVFKNQNMVRTGSYEFATEKGGDDEFEGKESDGHKEE
jgi:hypothetical protein